MMAFGLLCIIAVVAVVQAQIPCDDAYGQFCPEAVGWKVGDCLDEHKAELPQLCLDFINLTETCKSDIMKHCADKAYTGELISCLTEWTKPEDLSEECKEKLPKKETKKERGQTKEQRANANRRRRIRNQAAREARDQAGL